MEDLKIRVPRKLLKSALEIAKKTNKDVFFNHSGIKIMIFPKMIYSETAIIYRAIVRQAKERGVNIEDNDTIPQGKQFLENIHFNDAIEIIIEEKKEVLFRFNYALYVAYTWMREEDHHEMWRLFGWLHSQSYYRTPEGKRNLMHGLLR